MPILNYSTKVAPEKTIADVQKRLVKAGARQMSFDYSEDGVLTSLGFQMIIGGRPMYFLVTPDIDGVLAALSGAPKNLCNKEHACRVAWRIEKDWLEVSLAKIEARSSTPLQMFLSYAVGKDGMTFHQMVAENNTKFLM